MQGIMKCGMGNWTDIAQQFVKTKSWDECEKFYQGCLYIPNEKLLDYQHVCEKRDLSGEGNHKIREEIQLAIEKKIERFEEAAQDFKAREAREFDNGFTDNFSASQTDDAFARKHAQQLQMQQRMRD